MITNKKDLECVDCHATVFASCCLISCKVGSFSWVVLKTTTSQPIRRGLNLYLPLHIPKFPFFSVPEGQFADVSQWEDLHSSSGSNNPPISASPTFGLLKTAKIEICQAIMKYQLSGSRNRVSHRHTITVNSENKKSQLSFISNEIESGQCFACFDLKKKTVLFLILCIDRAK